LTLRRVIQGNIDYQRLLEDRAPLDRTLARAAIAGPATKPDLFPGPADRLAYLINCYNAAMLRSIAGLAQDSKLPQHVPLDLEIRFAFNIDGQKRTPADLRREIESLAADDWP